VFFRFLPFLRAAAPANKFLFVFIELSLFGLFWFQTIFYLSAKRGAENIKDLKKSRICGKNG